MSSLAWGALVWFLAGAVPSDPAAADQSRATVTRPSGGSSSQGGSVSSGGGSASGGRSTISSDARGSVSWTRPGGSGDGRTVIHDDRRSHHHGHGGFHGGYWGYHYPWHDSWYWGPWWGYGYWGVPYGYGYPAYPGGYVAASGYGMGALDLNVQPKDAEVHVNGQYLGLVRQYDGFPGYLWLERGTYELTFYRPGFETATRQFEIFSGMVLDVSMALIPGEAILPSSPEAPAAPYDPRSAPYGAPPGGAPYPAPGGVPYEEPGEAPYAPPAGVEPSGEPGQILLDVLPAEASVYLDGRFVGTGEELSRLHGGLMADPGAHVLEVVGPGRVPETVHFEVAPGQPMRIVVRLDPAANV